jgi:hypothetical protein
MRQQASRYASVTVPARAILGDLAIDVALRARSRRQRREEREQNPPTAPARAQRIRRPGAGRPELTKGDLTRGDPESPLRWTCKSKAKLATELQAMGHTVSATQVGRLLHQLDYSLQVVRKTREGNQSPDRDAQFKHINATAKWFMKRGQPVRAAPGQRGHAMAPSNGSCSPLATPRAAHASHPWP